ncbi:MAG: DUF2505 family protein [Myxococcota bacterium]
MTELSISRQFPTDQATFMKLMADPQMHAYVTQKLGTVRRRQVNEEHEGSIIRWTMAIDFMEELPSWTRSLISTKSLMWQQHFEMDLEKGHFQFRVAHPFPSSWMEADGEGWVKPQGAAQIDWKMTVRLRSQLPLLGGRIEKLVATRTQELMEKDMDLRLRYLSKQQARQVY